MRRFRLPVVAIVAALAVALPTTAATQGGDPGIAAIRAGCEGVIRTITMAAEELPDGERSGTIITDRRLQGLVPPSSRR